MEHDPNLVFVKDADSVIVYANRAFLEVCPPDRRPTIIGTTTIEQFSREEAAVWLAEDRRAMALGRTELVEEIVDYEGRRRVLLTRKIAFATPESEARLLGISTDITELADRERALVEVNDRLSKFSAFAAHDLRSPLASIVSAIDIVLHDPGTHLSKRTEEVMELVSESAMGLAQQVTTLLESARAGHRDELDTRLTDLNLLVGQVRFNLSSLIQRTGASLHATRLPSLRVEPNLFRQLLQNLVENSIRHRSERTPIIVVHHEEKLDEDVISIEDNGVGVSEAEIRRIFEAFEQGPESSGTGLGLALCRRVIALHEGSMWIDTSFQSGCRVVLRIPRGRQRVAEQAVRAA